MKILLLADEESKYLWDFFSPDKIRGYDLIISCGDLNPHYLTLLATFTSAPLLYVHGNHDTRYLHDPPEGCICIEDDIFEYRGIRVLGLGGSFRYKEGPFQYTERQMANRIRRLRRKLKSYKGFDILVTHAPARDLNDGEDLPHRGFECFNHLLEEYSPSYFVHGHVHMSYNSNLPRCCQKGSTTVINAYEKHVIEFEPDPNRPVRPDWWQVWKRLPIVSQL
ncbi:metallophosphoesterase family protein [Fournierella sp.]|uniref:metallophosphoesterase family protein n=1 Tax=Allofournierella sp. TaxID=1940256 RepID=UPI0025BFD244|nr:metallophosphoesterase family protein [Fournierella sp.]